MKPLCVTLAACVVLTACSPQYRNGAVRPTVPETLAGAHADANSKVSADKAPAGKDSHDPNF